MKNILQQADEIPVTMLVALAYVTLAFLTSPTSPTSEQLQQFGWLTPLLVSNGEPWRLLSSAFLHGGLLHLAFNTYALLMVGPTLERTLGSMRMAVLYIISALGGSLAICLLYEPRMPCVGGSGALFGMLGGIVAIQMRQGRNALDFLNYDGPRRILGLIGINLVLGLIVPVVSNTAHVGGLLSGFAVAFLFLVPSRHNPRNLAAWRIAFAALMAGVLFYALQPATRWDWLWQQSQRTTDLARRQDLQEAAIMSYFGKTEVTERDARRFKAEVLRPK